MDDGVQETNKTDKDNVKSERNKQIILFFAQLVHNSKTVVLDSNRNIPLNSILAGIVNMNTANIYSKLEERITELQALPTIDTLYDVKYTYRTALAESFKNEGVYLKDWDNFRPFYNPDPSDIDINTLLKSVNESITKFTNNMDENAIMDPKMLYENRINNVRSNFIFSISLINMLNEYVSKSKKLINMNFLYNSVGMVPVDVLKEQYSYFTFPLLESKPSTKDFNIIIEKGEFRKTALSLLSKMNEIDKMIQKTNIDKMIYPLSYSEPTLYNLMYYFNFQDVLTGHLNDEEELKYYQDEIKHILLLFDIRLENEIIVGTGKQREFMLVQSNGLFNRFFNEIFNNNPDDESDIIYEDNEGDEGDEGDEGKINSDEAKYMFIDYEDNTVEVDIREVPDMKKAGLFIHKWNIPYDKPMKDGCGDRSEVNYMEFAKEHLRKIDTLSGKSSMHLYRELNMFMTNYPATIQTYKDLLSRMLQYINRNNVILFNDLKINNSSKCHR